MAGAAVRLSCSLRFLTIALVPVIALGHPITQSPRLTTASHVPATIRA
jgi:hypothetical protein